MWTYYYKKFIYFAVVLGFLSYSHFSYANVEVENTDGNAEASTPSSDTVSNEAEAGNQVQEMRTNITTSDTFRLLDYRFEFTGLFGLTNISNSQRFGLNVNLMGDILYRIRQYDRWNSSIGLRYRANFGHPTDNRISTMRFHHLTLLIQNLIFIKERFFSMKIRSFIGPVFGLHIWKSFRINYMTNENNPEDIDYQSSSEFFWNYFSYQFGVKFGTILSSHFAITMEIGFDQLGFHKYKERSNRENEIREINNRSFFNNTYVTLGLSYFL